MAFSMVSCGTQKAAVSKNENDELRIQSKFLGVQFGDSPTRVYMKVAGKHPTKKSDGSYTICDQEFAGYNWHYVQMGFVEKMLSIVNFQQEFNSKSSAEARFESIYRVLRMKYGEMEPTSSGDGFKFSDSVKNAVIVTVHPGISRGGKDFWYCDLTYYWGGGVLLTYMKSLSEI